MKQQQANPGKSKSLSLSAPGGQTSTEWGKTDDKRRDTPVPPPVWTRYIDSRLKQFCVR